MKKTKKTLIVLLAVLLILTIAFFACNLIFKALYPDTYKTEIYAVCDKYDIDPYLMLALIKAESNFVTDAKSNKNAIGLMQITEKTAVWIAKKNNRTDFTVEQLVDPMVNIQLGAWYLDYLLEKYNNDEFLALCAYNAGEGTVDGWLLNKAYSSDGKTLNKIPYSETEKYVSTIFTNKDIYVFLYPEIKRT